ncbi:hypothetical protein SCLCIDRAFT_26543 [Scleroderma citrinum Foug A]|uniref:Uncharacterized protein n=1 Tax=Scleroderma citrinum Foug A TaxID=1036808 RepID=A0A0C2ZFL9_9AGAM|nr:hypothetical protein SCLCIDRAFT_26543 [Scleroderma citrinum Foug A]
MDLEWEERRHRELNLADGDAAVPIIRGGLEIAARLEYMSVSTLVIDKYPRLHVKDNVQVSRSHRPHETVCIPGYNEVLNSDSNLAN